MYLLGEKYIPDNNKFSEQDKNGNKKRNIMGYLTTPNGALLEYIPSTEEIIVIASDMPSDPKIQIEGGIISIHNGKRIRNLLLSIFLTK